MPAAKKVPEEPPPIRVMPERPTRRGQARGRPALPRQPEDTPPGVARDYPPSPPMPQE
ncbi:hypothetical protein [Nocardiopsis sp. NRRL B-16309]|uniref:hypothetical protein n=1 Tax=Nocardiopsis sp. NRRL B-16309 TaxID=1519494 RepID=UPI000AE210EF|nr:hypothetical protein [Nocardiopsis sp. NRRL B-16309]